MDVNISKHAATFLLVLMGMTILLMNGLAGINPWQTNYSFLRISREVISDFDGTSLYECRLLLDIQPKVCSHVGLSSTRDGSPVMSLYGNYFSLAGKLDLSAFIKGADALASGRQSQAIKEWKAVENIEWYLLNLARQRKNNEDKVKLFTLSIKVKPELVAFLELSKLYAQSGDYEKSLQFCAQGIDFLLNNHDADPYLTALIYQQIAHAKFGLRDYPSAIIAYRQALALWPDLPESYAGIARIHLVVGEYDMAIDVLTKGLEVVSRKYWLNYWLAVAHNRLEEPYLAIKRLRLALGERKELRVGWLLLGRIAEKIDNMQIAKEAYLHYHLLSPSGDEVQNTLQSLETQNH